MSSINQRPLLQHPRSLFKENEETGYKSIKPRFPQEKKLQYNNSEDVPDLNTNIITYLPY